MIFRFRRYSNLDRRLRQIAEIINSTWKIQRDIFEQFLLTSASVNLIAGALIQARPAPGSYNPQSCPHF
jgi:hypothetical protein